MDPLAPLHPPDAATLAVAAVVGEPVEVAPGGSRGRGVSLRPPATVRVHQHRPGVPVAVMRIQGQERQSGKRRLSRAASNFEISSIITAKNTRVAVKGVRNRGRRDRQDKRTIRGTP